MKTIFAIYAQYTSDARALETIDALSYFSDVIVVSYDRGNDSRHAYYTCKKKSYLSFIQEFIKAYKKEKPDVVFLHDNYCAPLIPIIKRMKKNQTIIYDSSELYYDKRATSLSTLAGRYLQNNEERYLKCVDGVFAANIERALIMRDRYGLPSTPMVFDNIHRIDEEINIEACDAKFSHLFMEKKKIIFYCGGIGERRRTFELIRDIEALGNDYMLIIAGATTKYDLQKYKDIKQKSNIGNFEYIGYITRGEIKYLLQRSDISVSLFDYSCANNIFCASGKVYESLFVGTPVLVSENPPLKRLCEDYGIGVSCDDLGKGISLIIENYDSIKRSIIKYCEEINYESRIDNFSKVIKQYIDDAQNRKATANVI